VEENFEMEKFYFPSPGDLILRPEDI